MNFAIVDDDERSIDSISSTIKEYSLIAGLDIGITAFHSAEEFLEGYRPFSYTAVFMDIYMTGMTGIEAARTILQSDRHAVIIFLTSSDEHMGNAFAMHAYDYIEKPANRERIFQVMDDVMLRKTEFDNAPRLFFTSEKKDISIPYQDIMFIRTAERNYLEIAGYTEGIYKTRLPFSRIEKELSPDSRFITVIRGVIVNMDFIKQVEKDVCILDDDTRLPLSTRMAEILPDLWQNQRLDSLRNERGRRRRRK